MDFQIVVAWDSPAGMSETKGGIVINGAIANKALESLRKFAASYRNSKVGIGGKSETVLHLIIGLKDKEEYKKDKQVLLNLRYPLDNKDDKYEIVFVTKGDAAKMQDKLDSVKHLSTVISVNISLILVHILRQYEKSNLHKGR